MKSKEELLKMLYVRLAELQDGRVKADNPKLAEKLAIELALLYEILGEEVDEEYWEQIEHEIDEA